eukprot:GHVU01148071.1.p2 GENE.GHVU01148071.1~~GHVU01148071.1.p2  ORF type:complete len:112 (+),score=20.63 GHVU01148071.1:531-866(+)
MKTAEDIDEHVEQLHEHFTDNMGGPVIVGVGELAFGIAGVASDDNGAAGESAYLVFDPHYTGAHTSPQHIYIDKGWVGWKKASFFGKIAKGGFLNLCLPLCAADATNKPAY